MLFGHCIAFPNISLIVCSSITQLFPLRFSAVVIQWCLTETFLTSLCPHCLLLVQAPAKVLDLANHASSTCNPNTDLWLSYWWNRQGSELMPKTGYWHGNCRWSHFLISDSVAGVRHIYGRVIPFVFPLQWDRPTPPSCKEPEKSPWIHVSWQVKCQGNSRVNTSVWGYFGKQLLPHLPTTCCTSLSRTLPGKDMGIEDDFRNKITTLKDWAPFLSSLHWSLNTGWNSKTRWGCPFPTHHIFDIGTLKIMGCQGLHVLGIFARGKQVLLRVAPQETYLFMQNYWNIKYQLATDLHAVTLTLMFDERLLCCICIPDSSTLLQDKAKTMVCSCGWITSSPMLANVRKTGRLYGYGHANLHLAGASSCMQLITLALVILQWPVRKQSHTLESHTLVTQKDIRLQWSCLERS